MVQYLKVVKVLHHINNLKEKSHRMISLNEENVFDKVKQPFLIKVMERLGLQDAYFNIINTIYSSLKANQIKWNLTHSNSTEIMPGGLLSQYLSNIVLKVLARTIRQLKNIMGLQIGKEEVKATLFADDVILYISDLKISTKEHSTAEKHSSEVAEYQTSSKKKKKQSSSIRMTEGLRKKSGTPQPHNNK